MKCSYQKNATYCCFIEQQISGPENSICSGLLRCMHWLQYGTLTNGSAVAAWIASSIAVAVCRNHTALWHLQCCSWVYRDTMEITFHWLNPSSHTSVLGSTLPVTEIMMIIIINCNWIAHWWQGSHLGGRGGQYIGLNNLSTFHVSVI